MISFFDEGGSGPAEENRPAAGKLKIGEDPGVTKEIGNIKGADNKPEGISHPGESGESVVSGQLSVEAPSPQPSPAGEGATSIEYGPAQLSFQGITGKLVSVDFPKGPGSQGLVELVPPNGVPPKVNEESLALVNPVQWLVRFCSGPIWAEHECVPMGDRGICRHCKAVVGSPLGKIPKGASILVFSHGKRAQLVPPRAQAIVVRCNPTISLP